MDSIRAKIYSKRCAQSAGPGVQRRRLIFGITFGGPFGFTCRDTFEVTFTTLGTLLESFLQLRGHFGVVFSTSGALWVHFGRIFRVKDDTRAAKVDLPKIYTISDTIWRFLGICLCFFANLFDIVGVNIGGWFADLFF